MGLTTMAAEDLAQVSEKELSALKDSGVMQLTKQMESLKLAMAPIGESLAGALSWVLEKGVGILEFFNGLGDGVKKFIAVSAGIAGLVIPAFAMFLGLMGNLLGSVTNFVARFGQVILAYFKGVEAVTLYNTELTEEIALSNAVADANNRVTVSINTQAAALTNLSAQYQRLAASRMPGGAPPLRFATGGKVPGTGSGDKVPALLTPGEFVVKKQVSQKNNGFLHALNNGMCFILNLLSTPTVSTPTCLSQSLEASIDINVDPTISPAELTQITDSISQAISVGVVDGTQEGLDKAKPMLQQGMDAAGKTARKNGKNRTSGEEVRRSFGQNSGDYGHAMMQAKTQTVAAHDTEGVKTSLREYMGHKSNTYNNSPQSKLMREFGRMEDVAGFDPNNPAMAAAQNSRLDDIILSRNSASVNPQPLWQNDSSKRPGGTSANLAAKSMLNMHNDPRQGNLLDGDRANLSQYADANNLSKEDRSAMLAQIDAAEQRTITNLEAIAADTESQARWVESSAQKTQEIDVVWNEKLKEIQGYQNNPKMKEFDDWKTSPGTDGRLEFTPDPVTGKERRISAVAPKMMAGQDGRYIVDQRGNNVARTATGGHYWAQDKTDPKSKPLPDWSKTSTQLQNRNKGKNDMLNSGFTPADVKRLEDQATIAGVKVVAAYTAAVKKGPQQSSLSGVWVGKIKLDAIEAGREVSAGVVQGMQQGQPAIYQEGMDDGQAAIDGAEDKLQIASPSRVFKRIGNMVTTGFVGGMKEGTPAVKQEGAKVGSAAVQGAEQGAKGTAKAGRRFGFGGGGGGGMARGQMAQMGMGSAISMASMIPQFTGQDDIMGVSSEFTMGIGMATGQIASFSSMLGAAGPYVAGFAAAVGVAMFAAEAYAKSLEAASDKAYELGASLGGAAGAADTMSAALGKATAIQKRNNLEYDDSEKQKSEEFAAAFGSEGGKALVEELSGTFGAERGNLAAQYIETAVLNGMIESDQAGTFAKVLANELGDTALLGRLSGTLQKMESTNYTRTDAAMSVAEKREKAISQDSMVGKNGSIDSVGKTIGAAGAALSDFATVAAVAEQDYADGIISYKEYIEALNVATVAQTKYSNMLNQSVQSGDNSATTRKAVSNFLGTQGLSQENRDELTQRLEDAFVQEAEDAGKEVDLGNYFSDLGERLGWNNKRENAEKQSDFETSTGAEKIGNPELDTITTDNLVLFGELNAVLGDAQAAEAVVVELMNEQSQATKAYLTVLKETEDQTAAVNAALGLMAVKGTEQALNDPKYLDAYADMFGVEGVNPELVQKMLSQGQTEEQLQRQFANITGASATYKNLGNMGEGDITKASPGFSFTDSTFAGREENTTSFNPSTLNQKQKAEYINAMGSVAELIGPAMQSTLTRYVTEAIEAGVVDGGTEGISELSEVLGGDQQALNAYISLDIKDGELDQAKEIAAQLKYIKDEIPPNMMVAFGIDIKNLDHYEKLMNPEFVDRLSLVSKMVETLPENEKTLSAKFAFDIEDPNGEPMTTRKFLTQWRGIQAELADLDGKDYTTNMTAILEILTKVNDKDVTPEQASTAMDDLTAKYKVGTIKNLPPITLTTVLDIQIDTTKALADLQAAKNSQDLLLSGNSDSINKAIAELTKTSNDRIADQIAPPAWNTGSGDSGGSGSDKDKNWIEQLEEDYKKENKIMSNMKDLADHNLKEAKDINKINEEVMRFLAEDDEAMKDFNSGKYSAKDINNMYFGNMAKNENAQTKNMRKSSRREDLVKMLRNLITLLNNNFLLMKSCCRCMKRAVNLESKQ